jgi:hypothetical protein
MYIYVMCLKKLLTSSLFGAPVHAFCLSTIKFHLSLLIRWLRQYAFDASSLPSSQLAPYLSLSRLWAGSLPSVSRHHKKMKFASFFYGLVWFPSWDSKFVTQGTVFQRSASSTTDQHAKILRHFRTASPFASQRTRRSALSTSVG